MAAMKAKDQVRLNAVRSIKSAILLARTAEGASGELTDGDIVKLIQKLVKQRKEAAEQYVAAGRKELADSSRAVYRNRSREMALAVGEESILGEFLLNMFPKPEE